MKLAHVAALAALLIGPLACAGSDASAPDGQGTLRAPLVFPGPDHGVTLIAYNVVEAGGTCADAPVATKVVPVETEMLPAHIETAGSDGDKHPFGDALFILPPGDYLVCATPHVDAATPSPDCAPVSGTATVVAEQTTEIVLISQCEGEPAGGLDVVVVLNDPPRIDNIIFETSKFITMCEFETITVAASDPNGDLLTYAWEIVTHPPGQQGSLVGGGASVQFRPDRGGMYEIKVTVDDGHDRTARLTFPVHVSPGPCCQGSCGGQAAGGDCYCDDECFGFGDCCADVCEFCPAENPGECGTCTPDCLGKDCGGDGCGGTCGGCAAAETCTDDGLCECVPQCAGETPGTTKQCGDDGCGGVCGVCAADSFCDAGGQCVLNGIYDGFYEGDIYGSVAAPTLGLVIDCNGPMFADVDHLAVPEVTMQADCIATSPIPLPGVSNNTITVAFTGDVMGDQGMGDIFVPLLSASSVGTWLGTFSGPQPAGPYDLDGSFAGMADLSSIGIPVVINFDGTFLVIQ